MFRQRHIHRQLAEVVGDPLADEATWMRACLAAGDKPLVIDRGGGGSSKLSGLMPATRCLTTAALGLNLLASWGMILLLCQQFVVLLSGAGEIWYRQTMGFGPGLGIILSVYGLIGFWQRFLAQGESKTRCAVWFGLLTVGLGMLACGSTDIMPALLAATFAAAGGAAAFFTLARLASYTRKMLPDSFRADRLAVTSGLAVFPMAAIMALGIASVAAAGGGHSSTVWYGFSLDRVLTIISILAISTIIPSYVAARVSRAQSWQSCLALNTIVNSPIILGLLAASLTTTVTGFNFANPVATGALVASNWAMLALVMAMIGSASSLAALRNTAVSKRLLKKAGYHQAIAGEG